MASRSGRPGRRVRAVESAASDADAQGRPASKPRGAVVPPSFRRFAVLAIGAALAATQCAVQAQAAPDTLGRIRAAKQIDVAYSTDSPPFSFAGEGKRPTGYSIDL